MASSPFKTTSRPLLKNSPTSPSDLSQLMSSSQIKNFGTQQQNYPPSQRQSLIPGHTGSVAPSRPRLAGFVRRMSQIWQDSLSSSSQAQHSLPSVSYASGTSTPHRRCDRTTNPISALMSSTKKSPKRAKSSADKQKAPQLVRLISVTKRQSDDDSDEDTCDIHDSPAWWILVRFFYPFNLNI